MRKVTKWPTHSMAQIQWKPHNLDDVAGVVESA